MILKLNSYSDRSGRVICNKYHLIGNLNIFMYLKV